LGGVALCCLRCGCKGPEVPIQGEFSEADAGAIARWSDRSPIAVEAIARITSAVNLAALMNNGRLDRSTEVSVTFDDLLRLIRVCKPNWNRSFDGQGNAAPAPAADDGDGTVPFSADTAATRRSISAH
jgi:hypothetical protein